MKEIQIAVAKLKHGGAELDGHRVAVNLFL